MPSSPPLLTHRHVEVFRAVMTAGSVTGAAAALFTSQPTISRELARMESLLRLVLFGAQPPLAELFETVAMADVTPVVGTEAEALAQLSA